MKNLSLQFIFCLLTVLNCLGQNQHKIDSLKAVLKNSKEDSSKVSTLIRLSHRFSDNPESGMLYANQAFELANNLKNNLSIADAQITLSERFSSIGKTDLAIVNLKQANNLYSQLLMEPNTNEKFKIYKRKANTFKLLGDYNRNIDRGVAKKFHQAAFAINTIIKDTVGLIINYQDLARINMLMENNTEALNCNFLNLKLKEFLNDKASISDTYFEIGLLYQILPEYNNALKYYDKALKLEMELGRKLKMGYVYTHIATTYDQLEKFDKAFINYSKALIYFNLESSNIDIADTYSRIGNMFSLQGKFDKAINYYDKALTYNIKGISGEYHSLMLHLYMGDTYIQIQNFKKAIENYSISLSIAFRMQEKSSIWESLRSIGYAYYKLNNLSKSKDFLYKSLFVAKELNSLAQLSTTYWHVSKLDSAQGNFSKSLENYKLYILYRDSITNQENTKKIVQTQMQYDFDKKEAATQAEQDKKDAIAVKELQKQKLVRNGFVGGFAVVLLFAGVFFTQRNKIKKGKQLSDELLLNILPSEVAEELKAKGSADAKQFDDVTVMFTDFKGFTQISEKLSPAELVAEIHTCFKAFDDIITKHNIEKIKTIGDAYMCAGGLPMSNTTHASDVVQAAIEIQHFMLNHLQERKASGKELFEIRIGIHTGPVVAGIVGVKKFAYDIWGDTVNIASRMESSSEAGKVNISGSTYELVKDKFTCIHRGKIQAKKKGEIDMYFVDRSLSEG